MTGLTAAGLRFVEDLFPTADHLTLATNDEYGAGADFLGDHRVDRNPPHVTYVVDPTEDTAAAHAVADHAYWAVRPDACATRRRRPARSTRARRPSAWATRSRSAVTQCGGTLDGGAHGPMPYVERASRTGAGARSAGGRPARRRRHELAAAAVDARRARLSCAPELDVTSDGPLDLRHRLRAARRARCPDGPRPPAARARRADDVAVSAATSAARAGTTCAARRSAAPRAAHSPSASACGRRTAARSLVRRRIASC